MRLWISSKLDAIPYELQMPIRLKKREEELDPRAVYIFDKFGKDRIMWWGLSDELMEVSKDVWASRLDNKYSDPLRTYMLGEMQTKERIAFAILGMSFENLFKGLIIHAHPEYVSGGRYSKKFPKSHVLEKLANQANTSLSRDEKQLLSKITEYVIWLAKYPVPLDATKILAKDLIHPDYENAENLLRKIRQEKVRPLIVEIVSNENKK
jgi:hypothetical protein